MLIILYTALIFLSSLYFFYTLYLKNLQDFHYMELNTLKEEISRLSLERDSLINTISLKKNILYSDTNNIIIDNTTFYVICCLILAGFSFYCLYSAYFSYLTYQDSLELQPSQLLLNAISSTSEAQLQTSKTLGDVIQNIDNNVILMNDVNFVNINNKIIGLDIKILELSQRIDHLITIFGPDKISPNTQAIIESIQNNASLVFTMV
jgi:hypothetical protein